MGPPLTGGWRGAQPWRRSCGGGAPSKEWPPPGWPPLERLWPPRLLPLLVWPEACLGAHSLKCSEVLNQVAFEHILH